ncbi:RAM signaling pathway protein-domain-containing protein [Thelonectria olida]|uniref:RAM signaling pathway protein-domain-containing protein n=1 Tax=Thelonectria olida TaxID=1576542 RepID=A0A9P8WHK8_9HYPO|nr:RAM signaling pathway protein-domain-containing protein [Thelonectria olida]
MDRPDRDRLPGPPPGPNSHQPSLSRILLDNPTPPPSAPPPAAPGRRPVPNSAATSNGPPPPPPPIPNLRKIPSNTALAAANMSSAQVISLAREAMRNALESENKAAEVSAVGTGIKTGVTIDLSRKNIQKLPEEVVDIVKNELERLALSHNQLSTLPVRFSECTSLRYLNIRGNQIKEFPMALCDLKSLEILDLGRNLLRVLPPDIVRLSSLKVLSVPKNQIRELPLCLADMGSLQVLKFEGNPISFPPRDAIQVQAASPPNEGLLRDSEVTEVAVTSHIKKFLKQYALNGKLDAENTGDESSEGTDTPRFPLKRVASGRFPIKVNGADKPDLRSPNMGSRPPPIPSRSHYRGLSQQTGAIRRPGVMPLTIGNISERSRSNSETLLRADRSESRNRRMGIVSRKPSDLGTLDETEVNNRFSHYRGLSHGSAMQGNPVGSKSPATPTTETSLQRPIYVRRLSVLPERRRESKIFDPIIEAAKGILYSVFQIHPMIQMLMSLTSDGSAKRSSLELVFYNTNSHVEELEQEIQKHETALAESEQFSSRENENVHRACQTLVHAYGHVCVLLADNIDTFVDNGDARYIRSLLMLLYNSIMELRATLNSINTEAGRQKPAGRESLGANTIRPHVREPSVTPTVDRPLIDRPIVDRSNMARNRNGTLVTHPPVNLRVTTDVPLPPNLPYLNGNGRTAALASATPRSGESFSSIGSRGMTSEFTEEDRQFERIFLSLQKSTDVVMRTIPNFNMQLSGGLRKAQNGRTPERMIQQWKSLIGMCNLVVQHTETLKSRLSLIKLKEPGVRTQASFWALCSNFLRSWTEMGTKIKEEVTVPLPSDTRVRLRPVQQCIKETSKIISHSPWQHFLSSGSHSASGSFSSIAMMSPTQVPITPQSAALGPAMQATVPTTPQSSSFAAAFHGNVFDRADALMANPGISMGRNGVFKGHMGYSSLSSLSSMSSDEGMHPSSAVLGPNGPLGPAPLRINGLKGGF